MKRVVGLQYKQEENELPVITVKAAGPIVDELLAETLKTTGPRIVRDQALLDRLYRLPTESAIDPSLFQVVANVLSYVFAVNAKMSSVDKNERENNG